MENGSTGPVDGRVYVDESGVTGFVEKPGAKGLGLLLGVVVRESDDAAVRKALQPSFERFVKALPSGMKPHITDAFASPERAVGTVAAETREMYEQIAMQQPVTVIYEAISASAFARRRDALKGMILEAKTDRRSGIRITSHPHRDRIEEEILEGFLLKVDAFAEDASLRHVGFLSDRLSDGVREAYQAALERVRAAGNQSQTVKGYDPATEARLTGSVLTSITVPGESGLEPAITRLGDVADALAPDELLLLSDILVNSLLHHLETTLAPGTEPLNAPSSIRGWRLEGKVYGALDDYLMDLL